MRARISSECAGQRGTWGRGNSLARSGPGLILPRPAGRRSQSQKNRRPSGVTPGARRLGGAPGLAPPSGNAVHPVDDAAVHAERGVMLADRIFVGPVEQAVHLAFGVVEQLNLPDAELVRPLVAGVVGDLRDRLGGQLEVLVEIHEPGHVGPSCAGVVAGTDTDQAGVLSHRRRAERARSASTAATAATSAAAIAITAICQPGMPPTTTVWITGEALRTASVPVVPPGPPGTRIIAIDVGAVPTNITAMTPKLPSKTTSLLKPLMMPMIRSPSRDAIGHTRIAALLTVRRYGGTTASWIGSDYPDLCSGSLDLCSARPRLEPRPGLSCQTSGRQPGQLAGPEPPVGLGDREAVLVVAGKHGHDAVGVLGQPAPALLDQRAGPCRPRVGAGALPDLVARGAQGGDAPVLEPAAPFQQDPLAGGRGALASGGAGRPAGHPAGGGDLQADNEVLVGGFGQRRAVSRQQVQHRVVADLDDGTEPVEPGGVRAVDQRAQHTAAQPESLVVIEHGERQLGRVLGGGHVPGLRGQPGDQRRLRAPGVEAAAERVR